MATKAAPGDKARRANSREKFPDTPDPVEIAMVAVASGKPLPDAARNVLEKHAKLIDRQAELAQAQCSELKLRRVGEGVRAALWAILAVAALAVVGMIAALLIRASRSDALVVQSFRVPPALAAQGLTGEVVATQVLDKLAEMDSGTNSVRSPSTYANNWEDELKIDIPNTGATTSEVWKLLRSWLGKETRITGEIIESGNGLALTARVGSSPGRRFTDAKGNLDALITSGAELIYSQTQPYRYAIYLGRIGREQERYPILKQLTAHESPMERKWAFSGLAFDLNGRGQFAAAAAMARRALAIDPNMGPALSNGAAAQIRMGHDQKSVDMFGQSYRTMRNAEYAPKVAAVNRCGIGDQTAWALRDPAVYEQAADCYEAADSLDANLPRIARAGAALLRHDPAPALQLPYAPVTGVPNEVTRRYMAQTRLLTQLVRGASPQLTSALDEFRKAAVLPASSGLFALGYNASAPTLDWPVEADALRILGRVDEAEALIARTPRDCYECVRTRGLIAETKGDAPDAQRWYAEAVRQGPRLPAAYSDWGRLLARHGRFASAEKKFVRATQITPSWADPLKYWGDMLAAQGKTREAAAKYDAALKLAPKWPELRQARARLGR